MQPSTHPGLVRQIRLPQAVALYVGAILGSGVLLIPGIAADAAGPSSALVWFLMSLLVLPMALTMGILATRYPNAGGVSAFVRSAFGPTPAAVAGWFFLAAVPIGAPVAAWAGASYAQVVLGLSHPMTVLLTALMLIGALVNNFLGSGFLGRSQVAISSAIIAVLTLAVVVAAPHVQAANFHPFVPHGLAGMGRAAALMFWCFIGWEAVSHLSEEFTDPKRDTVRAILVAALVVGVLYSAVGVVTVGTHAYGPGLSAGSLAVIVLRYLGPAGGVALALAAIFVCLGAAAAYIGAASRVAYSLAREGVAPAFLARLSPTRHTPDAALFALAAVMAVVVAIQATESINLSFLILVPNAAYIGTYVMASLAAVRLLKESPGLQILAWISLLLSAILFAFLGWAMLFAPLVGGLVWLVLRCRTGVVGAADR